MPPAYQFGHAYAAYDPNMLAAYGYDPNAYAAYYSAYGVRGLNCGGAEAGLRPTQPLMLTDRRRTWKPSVQIPSTIREQQMMYRK